MKNPLTLASFALCFLFAAPSLMAQTDDSQPLSGVDEAACNRMFLRVPDDIHCTPIIGTATQFQSATSLLSESALADNARQPVQMLCFEGDNMVAYYVNLQARMSEVFNWKWNWANQFAQFAPASHPYPLDTIAIGLKDFGRIYPEINPSSDYTVLLFWTNKHEKVTQKALQSVIDNLHECYDLDDVQLYLINADAFFSK